MKTRFFLAVVVACLLIIYSCSKKEATFTPIFPISTGNNTTTATGNDTITYNNTVKSIISTHCTVTCHKSGKSGFTAANLTNYAGIKKEVDTQTFKNKVIIQKTMPPNGSVPLSSDDIEKLQAWLDNGAPE